MFAFIIGAIGLLLSGYIFSQIWKDENSTRKIAIMLCIGFCILLIIGGCGSVNNATNSSSSQLFGTNPTAKRNSTLLNP